MAIYYITTILSMVIWSASYVFTDISYGAMSPIQVAAVRSLITTVIFFLIRLGQRGYAARQRRKFGSLAETAPLIEKPEKRDMVWIYLSGLFGITIYMILENLGIRYTTTSNSALIVASFPAITVLLEFLIYKIRPTAVKSIGIALAIAGVMVLTGTTAEGSRNQLLGNICLIAAGFTWAFYSFITRKVADKYSPITLTYYQMLGSTVFYLPFLLIEGAEWRPWDLRVAGAVLFLSLGCSFAAFLLYNFGLKRLSAGISAIFLNLIPVFGLVFSAVVAKETISAYQLIGGAVVIGGVILSCLPQRRFPEHRKC